MGVPGYTCRWCKSRDSVAGAVRWPVQVPMMLFLAPMPFDGYCRTCARKVNALGVLTWVVLAGAVAFLVVAIYG